MFEFPLIPLVPFGLPPATMGLTALSMLCCVLFLAVASPVVGGSAMLVRLSFVGGSVPTRDAITASLPVVIPAASAFALGSMLTATMIESQTGDTLAALWWLPARPLLWTAASYPVIATAMAFALRLCPAKSVTERTLSVLLLTTTIAAVCGWAFVHVAGRENRRDQAGLPELDFGHWTEILGRTAIPSGLCLAGAALLLQQRIGRGAGRHTVQFLRRAGRIGALVALAGALTTGIAMAGPVPRDRLSLLFSPAASAYPLTLLAGLGSLIGLLSWRRTRHARVATCVAWGLATIGFAGIRETVRVQTMAFGPAIERHHHLASRQAGAWAMLAVALVVAAVSLWRWWTRSDRRVSSSS